MKALVLLSVLCWSAHTFGAALPVQQYKNQKVQQAMQKIEKEILAMKANPAQFGADLATAATLLGLVSAEFSKRFKEFEQVVTTQQTAASVTPPAPVSSHAAMIAQELAKVKVALSQPIGFANGELEAADGAVPLEQLVKAFNALPNITEQDKKAFNGVLFQVANEKSDRWSKPRKGNWRDYHGLSAARLGNDSALGEWMRDNGYWTQADIEQFVALMPK